MQQMILVRLRGSLMALAVGLFLASAAQATTINLSTHSSDATPAAQLTAVLDFQIVNGGSRLALTVQNTSVFGINEVYFNLSSNVTSVAPKSGNWANNSVNGNVSSGWSLLADQSAAGFGVFDVGLIDGVGGQTSVIAAGTTTTFTMDIEPGTLTMDDFNELSTGGHPSAFAAAKFITGAGDDSAFGATVPEPATGALVGLGLLGLVYAGRRRL